ncbi:MAG: tetratricopeptide repeat protein [Flavobacteriaceae bacterium]|nr:tetratricopeptide repeat protein [Flavobacteriaceae bacterium]
MNKFVLLTLVLFIFNSNAQEVVINKESNNLTLDGNILFSENNLVEAESLYRKSISRDSANLKAVYNLGNSLYKNKLKDEAINQYRNSINKTTDKDLLHKSFHNLGNIFMQNEDYQNAVDSFKKALLNRPTDDETRYNYVLAKELLKNQQKNNKKDDKDKKNDKDNKDDKDKKNDKDKKDNKKEEQKNDEKSDKKNDNKEKNKPNLNKISPEQLKNLLKAMDNEEKKVQNKVNKNKVKGTPIKNKKDW